MTILLFLIAWCTLAIALAPIIGRGIANGHQPHPIAAVGRERARRERLSSRYVGPL